MPHCYSLQSRRKSASLTLLLIMLSSFAIAQETFDFTGEEQTYTVPENIERITIEAYGAQGGTQYGGKGAYVSGELKVTPGEVLYIYVGGQGNNEETFSQGSEGGWNGGGNGGSGVYGSSGGGASDVRQGGKELADRVIVAGGGGGCQGKPGRETYNGGFGGGDENNGSGKGLPNLPTAGTEEEGGKSGWTENYWGENGTFGRGGSNAFYDGNNKRYGGGGGGGYYGGGGGHPWCSGAGGSSYTGGVENPRKEAGWREGDGMIIITPSKCVVYARDTQTACDSYTWINGITYTESTDTPTFTLKTAEDCDSVITLELTINESTQYTDVQSACESFTWVDGNTYSESTNSPTVTLTNVQGCDSIVTLDLTIGEPSTFTDEQSACESYTWIDGNTYSESTFGPTVTLTNSQGCDSIVTLDLTIGEPSTFTDALSACDSYTWIDGNTYTESTFGPTVTLTNSQGCDSTVTLDLTIIEPSTFTDEQSACESYTWINGNTYTESTFGPTVTLTNSQGCDSIVTLDLTIEELDNTVTLEGNVLTANAQGASYQWLDCANGQQPIEGETEVSFTPTQNGRYAVEITQNNCVAISNCQQVIITSIFGANGKGNLSVFPNPTTGTVHIELPEPEETLSVKVYNAMGQAVESRTIQNGTMLTLDIEGQNGIYFIEVSNKEGQSTLIKMVKNE